MSINKNKRTVITMDKLPGILFCAAIAVLAYTTNYYIYSKVSPLMYAFIFSIIIANLFSLPTSFKNGIQWCSKSFLQFSMAMLGFTISALAWLQLGLIGVLEVLIVIIFALFFGVWFGKKMGLSNELSILLGAGCSICGATAIAALSPVIKPKEEEIGVAVATVTIFGLFAMVLYPYLFQSGILNQYLHSSQLAFGMWAGTGIHETSQVIPAGAQVGKDAESMAILAKSVRIFSIGPVVLICSYLLNRFKSKKEKIIESNAKLGIPKFAIFFVIFSIINSIMLYLPSTQATWKLLFDTIHYADDVKVFLAVAFAGVGFMVQVSAINKIGFKAFFVGMSLSILVGILALELVKLIYIPFNGL